MSEKHVQERDPSHVLPERVEQRAVAEAVLEEGVAQVAGAGEDDHTCEPDLETVEIEAVDVCRPTEEEIVHERQGEARCDTV